ncbi:hypothetical protein CBM2637_B10112 [Cupriavidus taiwanensis]|nr:hypothetical protein CBM2637_B10112 [Cupriavidus taiwanensis]
MHARPAQRTRFCVQAETAIQGSGMVMSLPWWGVGAYQFLRSMSASHHAQARFGVPLPALSRVCARAHTNG